MNGGNPTSAGGVAQFLQDQAVRDLVDNSPYI